MCFHVSWEAGGNSYECSSPRPQLLRQPLEFSKTYCIHPARALSCTKDNRSSFVTFFFSYRLGDLQMNPGDSQIRF